MNIKMAKLLFACQVFFIFSNCAHCGLVKRIVNGKTAVPHSWPWIVVLNSVSAFCAGSLIDPAGNGLQSDIVLTAAHCLINYRTDQNFTMYAILGMHNRKLKFAGSNQIKIRIRDIRLHKDYDKTGQGENDIAIVKLDEYVKFNEHIQPARLPTQNQANPPASSAECLSAGWGMISDIKHIFPEALQEITLSLVSDEICKIWSHGFRTNSKSIFCAGLPNDSKGLCYGDSGGPFICQVNGAWTSFGIALAFVAFNDTTSCGQTPNIFARTSYYINWIQEEAKSLNNDTESV